MVEGHENGYDNIKKIKDVIIKLNANTKWYNGTYEEGAEDKNDITVVFISSDNKRKHNALQLENI